MDPAGGTPGNNFQNTVPQQVVQPNDTQPPENRPRPAWQQAAILGSMGLNGPQAGTSRPNPEFQPPTFSLPGQLPDPQQTEYNNPPPAPLAPTPGPIPEPQYPPQPSQAQQLYDMQAQAAAQAQMPRYGSYSQRYRQQQTDANQYMAPVVPGHPDYDYSNPDYQDLNARNSKTKLFIIAGVVVSVFILIGVVSFVIGNSSKKSTSDTAKETTYQSGQSGVGLPETAFNFELKKSVYKDETVSVSYGKMARGASGIVLAVSGVDMNYKPETTQTSDEVRQYIKIDFLIGNASDTDPVKIEDILLQLEDKNGKLYAPSTTVGNYPGKITQINLSPGSKAKGSVVYESSAFEKPISFSCTKIFNDEKEIGISKTIITDLE